MAGHHASTVAARRCASGASVAAQNLQSEAGIHSRTIASLILSIQDRNNTGGLHGVDVLVLDEANLTDDRDRAILYVEAARTGTKIVELGDPKQLRGGVDLSGA
jgi:ATP-dependent exoDNAse (exonuclease V) alpha subunit